MVAQALAIHRKPLSVLLLLTFKPFYLSFSSSSSHIYMFVGFLARRALQVILHLINLLI